MTIEDKDESGAGQGEAFLARWSRRKLQQPETPATSGQPTSVAPALPPVENLNAESDFSGFMHPKVEDALRRVALKKLFSDPHFNIPDPFEPFSGDWTGGEAIPEAMLASLEQMQTILRKPPDEAAQDGHEDTAQAEPQKQDKGDEPGKQDT